MRLAAVPRVWTATAAAARVEANPPFVNAVDMEGRNIVVTNQ